MPNPPITVGELTDVPAPQSPVNAQFHQEVAHRIVHRFATVAAMNASGLANGSLAYVTANEYHYRKVPDGWVPLMQGDPEWIAYTPTTPGGCWNFSTASGRYMRVGDICHVVLNLSGFAGPVENPTLPLRASLPFAATGAVTASKSGHAQLVYNDGVILVAGLVDFSGGAVTLYPIITSLGQIHPSGFTLENPRGSSPYYGMSSVQITGWYPIG